MCLNDAKKESVVVVDVVGDAKATLALAEGIALGNYQFIKYKTKDFQKEKHTLKNIFVYSKKINAKEIEQLQIMADAVADLASGNYILQLNSGGVHRTKKLIRQ